MALRRVSAHRHQGGTLVFLIILIVATAVLIAWLLVELARLGLGDLRLSRVQHGSLQGASSGLGPGTSGTEPVVGRSRVGGAEPASPAQASRLESEAAEEERVLYDAADVEQAIRDRLYGGRGRST